MPVPLSLYPPLEPSSVARLAVGDGHVLHVETCGAPQGVPVLFLHGGPGSSINPTHRRFFDPAFYRIVLFDQRGCGRSIPAGGIAHNTTRHLVDDIERLRASLGIERWVLFGGSWGSTLALAYAQQHPQRVRAAVLRGVFLASREEVAWFVCGLRAFMPEAWKRLSVDDDAAPEDLIARYHAAVTADDGALARKAAADWSEYETAVMAVGEATGRAASPAPDSLLARVRVQLHYLINDCFLEPGALIGGMARLQDIPAILVQGRRDLVCPPAAAYTLHRAWTPSSLRMVEEAGHSALHPAMVDALVRATREVKQWIEGGRV